MRSPILLASMLLAVIALAPADAQPAAPGDLVFTDPANDAIGFNPGPAPVGAPINGPLDILEVGIGKEDELGLQVHIKVRDLNEARDPFSRYNIHNLEFALDGASVFYAFEWRIISPEAGTTKTGIERLDDSMMCMYASDENGGYGGRYNCAQQRARFFVDWDNDLLFADVTKAALMGQEPIESSSAVAMTTITLGSRLKEIRAYSYGGIGGGDNAPDEGAHGQPFVFAKPSANLRIRLRADPLGTMPVIDQNATATPSYQDDGFKVPSEWSVEPGKPTLIPLRLENTNSAKRIINLSASLEKPGNGWQVQIMPGIQVPGADARVVNLIVNATASIPHRSMNSVLVQGRSLGFLDELAAIRVDVVATISPSPTVNTLYFHHKSQQDHGSISFGGGWGDRYWINTLEQDPNADLDDGRTDPSFMFNGPGSYEVIRFELESPPTQDLVFDQSKPIELVLMFKTQVEFPGEIDIEIATADGQLIGGGSSSASFKTGTPVLMSFIPEIDRVAVEQGGFTVSIRAQSSYTNPQGASSLAGFEFIPRGSSLKLPLIADPLARNTNLAGPGLLTLATSTDDEVLVNPGEAKLFNLTLVNEGVSADEARVEVVVDDADWTVEFLPGNAFRLAPGESVKFSILVRAPADSKEGDKVHMLLNATSANDPQVLSQIGFTAVATNGFDFPDEGRAFETDEESSQKLVNHRAKKSPTVGLPLLAVLAGLAAIVRARKS